MSRRRLPLLLVLLVGVAGGYLASLAFSRNTAEQDAVADDAAANGAVASDGAAVESDEPVGDSQFKGKIARRYEDSVEWWPKEPTPPADAPNVLILLLDDVGFAQLSTRFGGLIHTPNIDRLADNGLRYNNFHTTALCSPSRATLMAGRNPHSIGLGSHALTAMGFPGYNAIVPDTCKSVANYLQERGYVNYALGKWDHTPLYEVSQVGPFHRWPSGEGFRSLPTVLWQPTCTSLYP